MVELKLVPPQGGRAVFVCDEMQVNVAKTLTSLEDKGFATAYYANASDGWRYVVSAFGDGALPVLFVVDMALLAGGDEDEFPDDLIDEGQITGIVFIEKLLGLLKAGLEADVFEATKTRIILYTRVTDEFYVKKAEKFARDEGIKFARKRINDEGAFVEFLLSLLE